MPRKWELTFQRGATGRVGRWKTFYRGKAYYLGSGRGKSDVASYREAVAAWGALKVQLDAEIVRLPRLVMRNMTRSFASGNWCSAGRE